MNTNTGIRLLFSEGDPSVNWLKDLGENHSSIFEEKLNVLSPDVFQSSFYKIVYILSSKRLMFHILVVR